MLAGTDDHLTWLSPVILNLENMGLTHLESEIRVARSFLIVLCSVIFIALFVVKEPWKILLNTCSQPPFS